MSFGFGSSGSGFNQSNSLFSSNQNVLRPNTSLFGQTTTSNASQLTNTTSTSQGSSIFSNAFGGFQNSQGTTQTLGGVVTGTVQYKFSPPSGQDTVNRNGSAQTINTSHQCITAMKEYELKSLEELRFEDYQANRRYPSSTGSAFGSVATGGLFSTNTSATTGGFGSNLFGNTQSSANKPTLFGSSTTTTSSPSQQSSIFGQSSQPNKSFFNTSSTPATGSNTSFSGFGSQSTTQSTFGTQPQQTSSLFGNLGAGQTSTTTGSLFGSSSTTPASTSLFGSQTVQNKPVFSGFGQAATTTAATTNTFSFGQNQPTTTPSTSIFGSTTATSTQSPLSTSRPFGSTFGSTTNTSFGQPATGTSSIFGSTTLGSQSQPAKPFGTLTTTTPSTSGFGGFGSPSTATTTSGGLFGTGGFGSTSNTQPTTTSSFGSTLGSLGGQTNTASPFGTTSGGGLFGSTQTQQQQQTQPQSSLTGSSSGFFSQPTTTSGSSFGSSLGLGGFGSTLNTTVSGSQQPFSTTLGGLNQSTLSGGGGLFGSTVTGQQQQQQSTGVSQFSFGGGLSAPSNNTLSGIGSGSTGFGSFGTSNSLNNISSFGLTNAVNTSLGQPQQQQLQSQLQQQQQPLVQQQLLSLSNSPYSSTASNLLKNTLQDMNKKEDIFKPVSPIAQRPYINEATSPAKATPSALGLGSITNATGEGHMKGGLSQTIKITPKALTTISLNTKKNDLFDGLDDEEAPCFYPRKNIKKLLFKPIQNTSLTPTNETTRDNSRRSSTNSSINGENFIRTKNQLHSDINTQHPNTNYGQLTTDSTNVSDDGLSNDQQQQVTHPANIVLERPGYFTIPSMQDLDAMTDSKGDCLVENFAIGRVDYGCITFPGITNLRNMNLDEIIHIRRKEVHVYPDESKKPPQGQGLNKPAEVTLHRIWPTDKQTKETITDPNRIISMSYNKKLERATGEMDAEFIDYDPVTGSWTFKVKHFSKYGLNDSDEDETDQKQTFDLRNQQINSIGGNTNNLNLMQPGSVTQNAIMNTLNLLNTNEKSGENLTDLTVLANEKEMIQKQFKLIEQRRMELTYQKLNTANNLNSISNQQWDVINEYMPTSNIGNGTTTSNNVAQNKNSYIDHSIHLELSDDSNQETDNIIDDDDDNDKQKDSIRKALLLDNDENSDNELLDDFNENNKENNQTNSLYPSLKNLQKSITKQKKYKLKKQYQIKTDQKVNSSLNNLNINETYNIKYTQETNFDCANNSRDIKQEPKIDELPFAVATGSYLKNGNRRLVDAFFSGGKNSERENQDDFNSIIDDDTPKLGSLTLNQMQSSLKPIGLLKRGYAGLQDSGNYCLNEVTSLSQRGDQFYDQPKVPKKSSIVIGLTLTDIKEHIGNQVLKPKLWNRFPLQNNTKLSSHISKDEKSIELNEKTDHQLKTTTDLQDINSNYIKLTDSITNKLNWCLADSSLFHSRCFRVNWSLYPSPYTFTRLSKISKNNIAFQNSIEVLTTIQISNGASSFAVLDTSNNSRLKIISENCEKFLKVQLDSTEFFKSSNLINNEITNQVENNKSLPYLRPKMGNELIKKCFECITDIRNSIGDHPDADNVEHMKAVWILCQNLWGDIPDGYKSDLSESNYELEQIRKRLLSEWLTEMSSFKIEKEFRLNKYNKNKDNYLNSIFSLLTGNRLLDACNLAIENNDFRLALLISQSSGSNDSVRALLRKQLSEWFTCNNDKYISIDRLKIYVLISGLLTHDLSYTKSKLINVCENLDWKRQFGLHLWFKCLPINSIHDALESYEKSFKYDGICNKPFPPYIEDSVSSLSMETESNYSICKQANFTKDAINSYNQQFTVHNQDALESTKNNYFYDTCYNLIKLYCNNNYPIENIISPLCHSSNQLDYRLSWHLLMSLVALQYNHVTKGCLDTLHDSFAMQLQSFGLWHWSIFIVMHIENEKIRENYVRLYLSKNVSSNSNLNDQEQFLIETLNIPADWIYEYKAMRAKYECKYENQLRLLLKAHKWNEAHSILMDILAPDFFIQQNFKTLDQYFSTLSKESQLISKWNMGGLVYLNFIRLQRKFEIMFNFKGNDDTNERILSEDVLKEIFDQLISLSNHLKEFDNRNPKKLYCSLIISKLLIKYFNVFIELNKSLKDDDDTTDTNTQDENQDETTTKKKKKLSIIKKTIVDRAFEITDIIPDHDLQEKYIAPKMINNAAASEIHLVLFYFKK